MGVAEFKLLLLLFDAVLTLFVVHCSSYWLASDYVEFALVWCAPKIRFISICIGFLWWQVIGGMEKVDTLNTLNVIKMLTSCLSLLFNSALRNFIRGKLTLGSTAVHEIQFVFATLRKRYTVNHTESAPLSCSLSSICYSLHKKRYQKFCWTI